VSADAGDDDFGQPRRVRPARVLRGELRVPADKSIAHRALLFNAMSSGDAEVVLRRPGGDLRSTVAVLRTLGAVTGLHEGDDGVVRVRVRGGGELGAAGLPGAGGETLDCGNSGTSMRLLMGALAGRGEQHTAATLIGDASLSRRPMERAAGPLRAMGADISTTDGHAPVQVLGRRPLRAVDHRLTVASAQVHGAVTLAALAADGRTTIETPGPTRDHTERLLAWMGAAIERTGPSTTTVDGPAGLRARSLTVPGDPSSAAAWLVAGALHPDAQIRIVGVGLNPTRLALLDVLREMGAAIEVLPGSSAPASASASDSRDTGPEPSGDLIVRGGSPLRAIDLASPRVAELIDELPLIGVAMAAADGTSQLRDASELRVKESDRIALVVRNLIAIGAQAEELPDGWRVSRGQPRDAEITTAGDHRIAIAFAVAALTGVASEVVIDDPACVDVSYPGFWSDLEVLVSATHTPASATPIATGAGA
jgi:3-phosphoshikimate 1-carboxyvinyltransferase